MSELVKLSSYSCPVQLTYRDSEKYRVLKDTLPYDFNDPMSIYGKLMFLAGKHLSSIREGAIESFAFECYKITKYESDFDEAYKRVKLFFLQSNDYIPLPAELKPESEWILAAGGEYFTYGNAKILKECPKNDSLRQQYRVMKKFYLNCAWKETEDFIEELWTLKESKDI